MTINLQEIVILLFQFSSTQLGIVCWEIVFLEQLNMYLQEKPVRKGILFLTFPKQNDLSFKLIINMHIVTLI